VCVTAVQVDDKESSAGGTVFSAVCGSAVSQVCVCL